LKLAITFAGLDHCLRSRQIALFQPDRFVKRGKKDKKGERQAGRTERDGNDLR
jgi:hypothetical protein